MDPSIPVTEIRTAEWYLSGALLERRLAGVLLVALAAVAVVLATIGVYGMVACSVTQRRQELAIRIALGARPAGVLWMVVQHGFAITGVGMMAGIPLALAAARLLESSLYGIRPDDPMTFGGLVILFASTSLAAGYFSGRKAARLDPMIALRAE